MNSLLLLRHAKAEGLKPGQADFDRHLTQAGIEDATTVGRFLQSKELVPDVVLSSPAIRARETTESVLMSAGASGSVRYDSRIYELAAKDLLSIISELQSSCLTLLVIGHNPAMEELVAFLTGQPVTMGTASLAQVAINSTAIDSTERAQHFTYKLVRLISPSEMRNEL